MQDFEETVTVHASQLRLVGQENADRRRRPCLIVTGGPHRGAIFPLQGAEAVIGRVSECTIALNDVSISRRHAEIRLGADGQLSVRDLGSRNGTLVNGERVTTRTLQDGDVIELGETTKLVLTWADPTQESVLRGQYDLATRDALTGCFRTHYLLEQLKREWSQSRRTSLPLSVLFIDVDFFKRVNDTHGHTVGDEVLQQLGQLLMSMARKSDLVARYGGEEFVILLPNTDKATALSVADRWRETLASSPMRTEAGQLKVTISIGVACNSERNVATDQDLLRLADSRLYQAKHRGRNCVEAGPV